MMTARKLCLKAWRHFRQRSLYTTRPRSLRKKDSSSFLFFDILGILAPIIKKSAQSAVTAGVDGQQIFVLCFGAIFKEKTAVEPPGNLPQ